MSPIAQIAQAHISIHTSPKGGDQIRFDIRAVLVISIHTSPKGGDERAQEHPAGPRFQSTPPRREVTHDESLAGAAELISIHTSPKGGDHTYLLAPVLLVISIHTSPKGGDVPPVVTIPLKMVFQSTPPRREVTAGRGRVGQVCVISIHTSPKGGDLRAMPTPSRCLISIHTSPKGGDEPIAFQ